VEQPGKADTADGRCAAELAAPLDQNRSGTNPGRLKSRNRAGRAAAHDQNISI